MEAGKLRFSISSSRTVLSNACHMRIGFHIIIVVVVRISWIRPSFISTNVGTQSFMGATSLIRFRARAIGSEEVVRSSGERRQ